MKQRVSWTGVGGHVIRVGGVLLGLVATAVVSWTGTAYAFTPPPQTSLNTCQSAVRTAAATFEKNKILAISTCLQRISGDIIKSNVPITATTARICVTNLRKIYDSRGLNLSLIEKRDTAIKKKCEPGMLMVNHNNNDITGNAGGLAPLVAPGIDTNNIETWCQRFTASGSITDTAGWIACIDATHECAAVTAIAAEYPRALEWFNASHLQAAITALGAPPVSDPNKYSDAMKALLGSVSSPVFVGLIPEIDGSPVDEKPDVQCPALAPPPTCATACCYIETTVGISHPTSCFEYTGTTAEKNTFKTNCTGKGSNPALWLMTAADGACSTGATFGVACSSATPSIWVQVPKDSSCP